MALAALAEGLAALWRIDLGEAHAYLLIGMGWISCGAAGRQGIAVGYSDDQAKQGGKHARLTSIRDAEDTGMPETSMGSWAFQQR